MNVDSMLLTSERGDELLYVTEHYRDLQGLRTAPLWASLLGLICYASQTPTSRWHHLFAFLGILLALLLWLLWSNTWYERHYGRVVAPVPRPEYEFLSILKSPAPAAKRKYGVAPGYAWAILVWAALFLAPHLFHRFDGRNLQVGLYIVQLFLLPNCFSLVPSNPYARFRRLLYLAAALFLCAEDCLFLSAHIGMWPLLAGIPVAMLLLNLYDHWLLGHLLAGRKGVKP